MKKALLPAFKQEQEAPQPLVDSGPPSALSLINKQVICVASLTQDSGKSLFTSSLAHLLQEQGLKVDLCDSRMGVLHHVCPAASSIVLVEMAEENSLWYHNASDIFLIVDPTRSNGSLLQQTSRFLDRVTREERPTHIRLVVNRSEDIFQSREIYRQIRKEAARPLIHLKYFGYLPSDPVLEAWKPEKNPFVVDYPEGLAAACLKSMASRLKDQHQIWMRT